MKLQDIPNCATIGRKQFKHICLAEICLCLLQPELGLKSLAFELAPYNFDRLLGEDCNAFVFVIVPLISLMKVLISIRASYVGDACSKQQMKDI